MLATNPEQDAAGWRPIGVTFNVKYSAKNWVDVIAAMGTAVTPGPPSVMLPGEGDWQRQQETLIVGAGRSGKENKR